MRGSRALFLDPLTPALSLREREFFGKQLGATGSFISRINEGNPD
jgi:hypothetical protein